MSVRPHLEIPSPSGLGLQHRHFRGHKHTVWNSMRTEKHDMNASVHSATCSWKVMKQIQAWKSQIRHKLHLGWEAKSMSRDWKPLLSWERKKATLESSWSILIVEHKNGFPCLGASQNQESPSSSRNSLVDSCSRVLSMTPVYCFSQFSSVAQSYPTLATPWVTARQASPSITNSQS